MKLLNILLAFLISICGISKSWAHPMPNSLIMMDVHSDNIQMEIHLPLKELELAYDKSITTMDSTQLMAEIPNFKSYITHHLSAYSDNKKRWTLEIDSLRFSEVMNEETGAFQELKAFVKFIPSESGNTRDFYLDYSLIMHQVASHYALITVRNDFRNGIIDNETPPQEVAVLHIDTKTMQVKPYHLVLQNGSYWSMFKKMLLLGLSHIYEGTDHIMFVFMLLLPSTLIAKNGKWQITRTRKSSLRHILGIITSFTIGHCLTLALGTLGIVNFPAHIIEVCITMTILLSAVNAIKPIFHGKEFLLAMFFGLIHGCAFSETLSHLQLRGSDLVISLLGFNLGIEIMQAVVVLITIPWLLKLSNFPNFYSKIRIIGAVLGIILALAWLYILLSNVAVSEGNIINHLQLFFVAGILFLAITSFVKKTDK